MHQLTRISLEFFKFTPTDEAWKLRWRESLQWKALADGGSGSWALSPQQTFFLADVLLSNCRDWQEFLGWAVMGWELISEQLPWEILRAECQHSRQEPRPGGWKDSKRLHGPWERQGSCLCRGTKQSTNTGKCQGDLLVAEENVCRKMGIIVRTAQPRKGWDDTHQNFKQLL